MPSKAPCANLLSFHLSRLTCVTFVEQSLVRVTSDLYSCNFKLFQSQFVTVHSVMIINLTFNGNLGFLVLTLKIIV